MGQKCKQQVTAEQYKAPSCCHCRQLISADAPLPEEERKVQTLHLLPKEPVLLTPPAPAPPSCRYNEIAELVIVAGQSRALQQRAQRQGVTLIPAQKAGAVLKVQPARDMRKYSWRQCICSSATAGCLLACSLPCLTPSVGSASCKGSTHSACCPSDPTPCGLPVAVLNPHVQVHRPDAVAFISQEVYRAALLAVFFGQVTLAGRLPLVGESVAGPRRLAPSRARSPALVYPPSLAVCLCGTVLVSVSCVCEGRAKGRKV
jgi:hypothetical protein